MGIARHQRNIKPALKRHLFEEAGGKCANPGCANWRSHVHHIKHWAVYKCHNAADMIALCPSCHDEAHHGKLKVTDEALYRWKGIERSAMPEMAHIYVEPALELKLLAGTIALSTTSDQVAVFKLSNTNRLTIRVLDGTILQISSHLQKRNGTTVLRVVENHVRVQRDPDVKFDYRAGHARVTVPATEDYIPHWVIQMMRIDCPTFAVGGRVDAFDIEVMKPGQLRVQGFWHADEGAVVITPELLSFCRPGYLKPLSIIGHGESSVLKFFGPIDKAMFNFA